MKRTTVQVGQRRIELSNLDKVLFPADGIVKAELVEYYVRAAPTVLRHVKGRPLSFVRFPDGIAGESFFQKRLPRHAPAWISHVVMGGGEGIDYVVATEEAALAWLANHACVELHQVQCRAPRLDHPDYLVFDLDPPVPFSFATLIDLALALREEVEALGYHAFVKTSGSKGLHLVAPLEPVERYAGVFEAVAAIAKKFVSRRPKWVTLEVSKTKRSGRVLIDIYRNRPSQTIVAPYSVRGLPGAPVSMPLTWEELPSLQDGRDLNLRTALQRILGGGDPWESIGAYATRLHTVRGQSETRSRRLSTRPSAGEALREYARKRDFRKTPEPSPKPVAQDPNAFVVHRHHATRLHYDLRLNRDGVLKSWAIPKGMPPRPGVKRMALQVEDHPASYLEFEGRIPKGEYGGGQVWVFALGRHEIVRRKKDGFYFRLQSPQLNAEYRIIQTRGKENLLERLDPLQIDWLRDRIEPMLAGSAGELPQRGDYLYEVKWDGIRAMISVDDGAVTIRSRNGRDITRLFPELVRPTEAFRAAGALVDCEIVCLDNQGKPQFQNVIRRLHAGSDSSVERLQRKFPVVAYLFDCLYLDGRPIVAEPLERRREWMIDAVKSGETLRISEAFTDGRDLYEAAVRAGLEGVVAKEPNSRYTPGRRTSAWLKIKTRRTADCIVVGYTPGRGDRTGSFGALHLARPRKGRLHYVGRVGTGFSEREMRRVLEELRGEERSSPPPVVGLSRERKSVWLNPRAVCEVSYASVTRDGNLREPVFARMRPDLEPEDCDPSTE